MKDAGGDSEEMVPLNISKEALPLQPQPNGGGNRMRNGTAVDGSKREDLPQSPAQRIRSEQATRGGLTEFKKQEFLDDGELEEIAESQVDPATLLKGRKKVEKAPKAAKGAKREAVTRQNFDKRHSRRMHRDEFMRNLESWRSRHGGESMSKADLGGGSASVYVRKRPLFKYESAKGEFDVVDALAPQGVVLHSCQMHADMKRMHVKRARYYFDAVFPETATNEHVFASTAESLVDQSLCGGLGTIFMFGQTGSGKTFTMEAIHRMGVARLFDAQSQGEEGEEGEASYLELSIYELAGKKVLDLLHEKKKELVIADMGQHAIEVRGAVRGKAYSTEEALRMITVANGRRATAGTDVNAGSSRSHSVVEVRCRSGGRLTMVDCAGTERKEDSMYHSAERRKEGAEINASLYALKECMRALRQQQGREGGGGHVHVPYRSSNLTKVLMESFVRRDAKIAVICTISPASTDTEHSMATLNSAVLLAGEASIPQEEPIEQVEPIAYVATENAKLREQKPSGWTHTSLVDFIATLGSNFAAHAAVLPRNINGKVLLRWPKSRFKEICGGKEFQGNELFDSIHAKAKAAEAALDRERRKQREVIAQRVG